MPGVSLITKGKICSKDPGGPLVDSRIVKLKVSIEKKKPIKINIKKVQS